MKLLYEVYFALINNKLIHYERRYLVTFDIVTFEYKLWAVDSLFGVVYIESFKSKMSLLFAWRILMGRREVSCL